MKTSFFIYTIFYNGTFNIMLTDEEREQTEHTITIKDEIRRVLTRVAAVILGSIESSIWVHLQVVSLPAI